jgi:hypothetical protein
MHLNQRGDGRAGAQVLAGVGVSLLNHAADWRVQDGIRKLLTRDLELRTALSQERLAITHLFQRIFVFSLCDFVRRIGGIEICFRQETLVIQLLRPIQTRPRGIHLRLRLPGDGRPFDDDARIGFLRPKPESHTRLLQRRIGLPYAKLEVGCIQPCDGLPLLDRATQIDRYIRQAAGYFETQDDFLIRRQCSSNHDRLIDGFLRGNACLDLSNLRSLTAIAAPFAIGGGGVTWGCSASGKHKEAK